MYHACTTISAGAAGPSAKNFSFRPQVAGYAINDTGPKPPELKLSCLQARTRRSSPYVTPSLLLAHGCEVDVLCEAGSAGMPCCRPPPFGDIVVWYVPKSARVMLIHLS